MEFRRVLFRSHAPRVAGQEQVLGAEAAGVHEGLVPELTEEPGGALLQRAVDGALDLEMEAIYFVAAPYAEETSHLLADGGGGAALGEVNRRLVDASGEAQGDV